MKDGLKNEIKELHSQIQNRSGWFIDFTCPDNEDIQDIAEKAKDNADGIISDLSVDALYQRYRTWNENMPKVEVIKGDAEERYFTNFLTDVASDVALASLKGKEKRIFDESVSLIFKFI